MDCPSRSARFLLLSTVSLSYRAGNRIHSGETRTTTRTLSHPPSGTPAPKHLFHASSTPQVTPSCAVTSPPSFASSFWLLRGCAVVVQYSGSSPQCAAHVEPLYREYPARLRSNSILHRGVNYATLLQILIFNPLARETSLM